MSATVIPNQSYLMKQMQGRIAATLGASLGIDLGGNITGRRMQRPWEKPFDTLYYPTGWRVAKEDFYCRRHAATTKPLVLIRFTAPRWDSEHSDVVYGPKTVDQKVNEEDTGATQIIRNNTDSPIRVARTEEVSIVKSFGSSIVKGVTLDVTKSADASVDATQTVSGSYAGVGAEASLSEHFGVSESKSKSESQEESKERSEEGSTTQDIAIEFDAKPRSYYLIEVKKVNERTSQPFDINGVMDFDIEIYFNATVNSRNSHRRPGHVIMAKGIDELIQIVHGYDTEYPSLDGYWGHAPQNVKDAIDWIVNPENRRIQVSGVSHASLDSNATYDIELLGNHVPDALAHLQVVDAEDA